MKSVTGEDLARVLKCHGWMLLRVRGSHHIYGKSGSDIRLSIPIHGNSTIKFGLLHHILKTAGLTEDDL